jgi:hypothetical protein
MALREDGLFEKSQYLGPELRRKAAAVGGELPQDAGEVGVQGHSFRIVAGGLDYRQTVFVRALEVGR